MAKRKHALPKRPFMEVSIYLSYDGTKVSWNAEACDDTSCIGGRTSATLEEAIASLEHRFKLVYQEPEPPGNENNQPPNRSPTP